MQQSRRAHTGNGRQLPHRSARQRLGGSPQWCAWPDFFSLYPGENFKLYMADHDAYIRRIEADIRKLQAESRRSKANTRKIQAEQGQYPQDSGAGGLRPCERPTPVC